MGHLSFSDILDTSLKVSWQEPLEKNGILTGEGARTDTQVLRQPHPTPQRVSLSPSHSPTSPLGPCPTLQHLPLVLLSPHSISPGPHPTPQHLPLQHHPLVPIPPHHISHIPLSPWGWALRGADGTGCVPGYRISWEEYNRTNTRVTHYLPNVTLEYRVTGLTALTTYTIEVAAMTSKGQGQLSSSTISSGVPPGECGGAAALG